MSTTQNTCSVCSREATFSSEELGRLYSRDHGLRRVEDLEFADIGSAKALESADWLADIIVAVSTDGVLQPILLADSPGGLELVDGNHRAWVAHRLLLTAPVHIFDPRCGYCTEEQWREQAMDETEASGWKY